MQLQADKSATRRSLFLARNELKKVQVTLPYSPTNIIAAKKRVAELEAGLAALDTLEAEDFPAVSSLTSGS